MSMTSSQITSLTIVFRTFYSGRFERKYQSSVSLAFVRGIHRWQKASNAENASILWRHHDKYMDTLWSLLGEKCTTFYLQSVRYNLCPFCTYKYIKWCFQSSILGSQLTLILEILEVSYQNKFYVFEYCSNSCLLYVKCILHTQPRK